MEEFEDYKRDFFNYIKSHYKHQPEMWEYNYHTNKENLVDEYYEALRGEERVTKEDLRGWIDEFWWKWVNP